MDTELQAAECLLSYQHPNMTEFSEEAIVGAMLHYRFMEEMNAIIQMLIAKKAL